MEIIDERARWASTCPLFTLPTTPDSATNPPDFGQSVLSHPDTLEFIRVWGIPNIGWSNFASFSAETSAGLYIMPYNHNNGLIHRTICYRVSAAIGIGRPYVCPVGSNMYCPNNMSSLKRSNMYWSTNMSLLKRSNMYLTDQYVIAEEQQYVLVNQYVIQNRQQYALFAPIYHQVQYDLQYILKLISYCRRCAIYHSWRIITSSISYGIISREESSNRAVMLVSVLCNDRL